MKNEKLFTTARIIYGILFTILPAILTYYVFFVKIKIHFMEYIPLLKSLIVFFVLWGILIIFWKVRDYMKQQKETNIRIKKIIETNQVINKKLIENIYARPSKDGFNHNVNYMENIIKPTIEELEKIFPKELLKEYFKEYYYQEQERKNNPDQYIL